MTFTYYDSEGHDTASVIRSVVDCDISYVFFLRGELHALLLLPSFTVILS